MKNVGVILIGIAVAIIAGAISYAMLNSSDSAASANSEAEFLDSVRSEREAAPAADEEPGTLPPSDSSDYKVAKIDVGKSSHDMGVIKNNTIARDSIPIKNVGEAPLRISRVATTCGCTQGKMAKDVIPPGGEAMLNITVDPYRIPKFQATRTLTIYSNDPDNGAVKLDVSARVDPEIQWTVSKLDFGTVAKGEGATRTFTIRQVQEQPFEVQSADVRTAADVFDTSFKLTDKSQWKNENKREYEVAVTVTPGAPVGDHTTQLVIQTDIKRLRSIRIPVNAEVRGFYTVSPTRLTMKSVFSGETYEDVLTLSSERPMELVSVEGTNENLEIIQREGDTPNSYVFSMKVADEPTGRLLRDSWKFTIAADGEEYVEQVPVLAVLQSEDGSASKPAAKEQPGAQSSSSSTAPGVKLNATPESLRADQKADQSRTENKAGAETGSGR